LPGRIKGRNRKQESGLDIHVIPAHSLKIEMMSASDLSVDWILALKAVLQGVAFGMKENSLCLGQGGNREDESVRAVGGEQRAICLRYIPEAISI